MTSIVMTGHIDPKTAEKVAYDMPVNVQILSTVLFAAFAIPVTIVALNVFWPAGVAIALVLGWRGGFAPGPWTSRSNEDLAKAIAALSPEAERRSSGNTSFDAYRQDTLHRLEQEQDKFETFLSRLREAKDKTEFDDFMDKRAARMIEDQTRAASPADP